MSDCPWYKALKKVKQAVCEIDLRKGLEVLIDRPSRVVKKAPGRKLEQIAKVSEAAAIFLSTGASDAVRARAAELLKK